MEGVEDELELVGVGVAVAPDQASPYPCRALGVVHSGADPDGVIIEEEADLRPLHRGLAFLRLGLAEVGRRCRGRPRRLVQVAVEGDLTPAPNRRHGLELERVRGMFLVFADPPSAVVGR